MSRAQQSQRALSGSGVLLQLGATFVVCAVTRNCAEAMVCAPTDCEEQGGHDTVIVMTAQLIWKASVITPPPTGTA